MLEPKVELCHESQQGAGRVVAVDRTNFLEAVIEQSFQQPVLVDFSAQWCGPCQFLKPILRQLTQEYAFTLAEIDIDANRDLASQYQIQGVPDVRVCVDGQLQEGFVGALTEPQLRQFLNDLNLKSHLDLQLAALAAETDPVAAASLIDHLVQTYPDLPVVRITAVRFWVKVGAWEMATQALDQFPAGHREWDQQVQAWRELIRLHGIRQEMPLESDLDYAFAQAVDDTLAGEYAAALAGFLAIVAKNRKYRQDGARLAMLMIFTLLGVEDPLTVDYRRQLGRTLY